MRLCAPLPPTNTNNNMRRVTLSIALLLTVFACSAPSASSASLNSQRPSTSTLPGSPLARTASLLFEDALTGSTSSIGVYFPLSAYEQLKAISDPASDYKNRLLFGYDLDLAALHRLLLSYRTRPRFIEALTRPDALTWVPPGTCANRIGYWHLPGLRLVYAADHRVYSVAVLSMISWNAKLYVVHLGAFTHDHTGVVLGPESGPAVPWGPGGC